MAGQDMAGQPVHVGPQLRWKNWLRKEKGLRIFIRVSHLDVVPCAIFQWFIHLLVVPDAFLEVT